MSNAEIFSLAKSRDIVITIAVGFKLFFSSIFLCEIGIKTCMNLSIYLMHFLCTIIFLGFTVNGGPKLL